MSRTRIIFFVVLAVSLAIIATSLALQIIGENTALQLFVGATVFSVGVVALDFLGLLGHHGDHVYDPAAGHLDSGHGDIHIDGGDFNAGDLGGHYDGGHPDGGHLDGGHIDGGDADGGFDLDHAGGDGDLAVDDGDAGGHAHADETLSGHSQPSAAPILSVLSYLRLMVYFCLGFGPVGWVGMAMGRGALRSLAVAIPMGLGSLLVAQAFFRFQRRDTDSQIRRGDLLSQRATVLIPLDHRTMGKVRIQVGISITEQYALAANPDAHFQKGDTVQITKVTDECVYVR